MRLLPEEKHTASRIDGVFRTVLAWPAPLKPEWRNWQTRGTQNPVRLKPRVGSTPTSGTTPSSTYAPGASFASGPDPAGRAACSGGTRMLALLRQDEQPANR